MEMFIGVCEMPKKVPLSLQTEESIIRDYTNNLIIPVIKKKHNVGRFIIYKVLKKNGVKIARKARVLQAYSKVLNDFERGYIAALIDGEGSLELQFKQRKSRLGFNITPMIAIGNNSLQLLKYTQKILKSGRIKKRKQKCHILYACKLTHVLSILMQIKDYLIIKKRKAEIIIKFCELRLQKIRANNGCDKRAAYTEQEYEILQKFRLLNNDG
jgi:hypothetical protein